MWNSAVALSHKVYKLSLIIKGMTEEEQNMIMSPVEPLIAAHHKVMFITRIPKPLADHRSIQNGEYTYFPTIVDLTEEQLAVLPNVNIDQQNETKAFSDSSKIGSSCSKTS